MCVRADEGQAHLLELSKLAEKDPEFYKYLEENDRELLDFDPDTMANAQEEDAMDEDVGEEEEETPTLTKEHLRQWQKALLEVCLSSSAESRMLTLKNCLASFAESTSETLNCISSCRTHERRRSGCCMAHFEFGRYATLNSLLLRPRRLIESIVYNKLLTTTLRYTPVVLEHHIPYKTLANGKL